MAKLSRKVAVVAASVCFCIFCILLNLGCNSAQQSSQAADNRAADEAAVRKADTDWSNAAQAKQVDSWVAFYADDAVVLPPNDKLANNKDAIRKEVGGLFAMPGVSLRWQPTKVEVARSGDIAYSYGTYQMTYNDPKGNTINDNGKYAEVWRKQPDGSWKCILDTWSSDLPPTPTPSS